MYPSLSNRLIAKAFLCGLLLQSCRSGLYAIIEAPVLAQTHETTGQALSPGALPPASSHADAHVAGMLGSISLTEISTMLPAVVVPALLTTPVEGALSHTAVTSLSQSFVGPFTASSGERVLFSQQRGHWRAILAPGARLYGYGHTLPVVSLGAIGAYLEFFVVIIKAGSIFTIS
ncbi:MAG: hypothetical protein MUC61_03895 [Amoebophilaceae bacterium]|nr:hypothetical protein [Amoebophilaceae bacterium]